MKLIVGLGNPGPEYAKTRHNAGFMAIDRLAARHAPGQSAKARFAGMTLECPIGSQRALLLKPLTYMNRSGQSVSQALTFFKLDPSRDLLVLVDDAALDTGVIRIRPSGSSGGQNGLADVQRALGTEAYARLRIGVGPRPPVISLHDFVLGRFSEAEAAPLNSALERACEAAECFTTDGLDTAMNRFNRKDEPPPAAPAAPAKPANHPTN